MSAEVLARFRTQNARASKWKWRCGLTFPNQQAVTRYGILHEVYRALEPDGVDVPASSTSEDRSVSGYFTPRGDGILVETERGNPGFGEFQIDSYTMLIGKDARVCSTSRDDENCSPETYADFSVSTRTRKLLVKIVKLIVDWHTARGIALFVPSAERLEEILRKGSSA